MSERLGVLGGTFDPPHIGHVEMATAARDVLGLDGVVLAPATIPPHKSRENITPYEHRLAMAERAVTGLSAVSVSRAEEEGTGPSYTVALLERLHADGHDDIYFIIGSDSLVELSSWKDPQRVLSLCTLVVFPRGEYRSLLDVPGQASIVVFESPRIDVSSTLVRTRILDGASLDETMVPQPVLEYIVEHGLYGPR